MKIFQLILSFLLSACNAEPNAESIDDGAQNDTQVVVTMEGETHKLDNITQLSSTVTTVDGEIRIYLMQNDNPISVNLNMRLDAIPENGAAVFNLPDVNTHDQTIIDLSFTNLDRESGRTQKRILFKKGTVEVSKFGTNELRMTFDGSGNPLLGDEEFPIKGLINVGF